MRSVAIGYKKDLSYIGKNTVSWEVSKNIKPDILNVIGFNLKYEYYVKYEASI